METIKNTLSKIEEGKLEKKQKLLDAGLALFTEKGFKETSVQDIVEKANIAKGTFYLYYKDKYELQDNLIMKISSDLFNEALDNLKKHNISKIDKQIIFIIDYVIDKLAKSPLLFKLIGKNMSLGVFNKQLTNIVSIDNLSVIDLFKKSIKDNNVYVKNPEVTLYMIIELAGATCFNSITQNKPLPIEEYKPYLNKMITKMIYADEK
jgi:AcrR family transcriptional regulator